jgi:magnesium transporter
MVSSLVYRNSLFEARGVPSESFASLLATPGVLLWVDLSDPSEQEIRFILEEVFKFHPLAIEDCVVDLPMPKVDDYGDYLFLVMHAVDYTRTEHFSTTEVDLFIGSNYLVTFHRKPLRPVQAALDRHGRAGAAPVRGPDRLAHTLLDFLVEAYKPAITELEHDMELLIQDSLANIPAKKLFPRVADLRKEFSSLRQIVRPQREVAVYLSQSKTRLIRTTMLPYLRDLAEELSRIEAQSESWAEELILAFRVYLNRSSFDAGMGIKVLTGITALTIPVLTIGAWFGMNFKHMHELQFSWSYPLVSVLMLSFTVGMYVFMRRRRWL